MKKRTREEEAITHAEEQQDYYQTSNTAAMHEQKEAGDASAKMSGH